jgi:hypothetical protein
VGDLLSSELEQRVEEAVAASRAASTQQWEAGEFRVSRLGALEGCLRDLTTLECPNAAALR